MKRAGRTFLLPALLLLLLQDCQVLSLPLKILNTGLHGVEWAFQNAGGLIPLAGYLVMEDEESSPLPGGEALPGRILQAPPRGALALVLVPPERLGDPRLEEALGRKFPAAGGFLPLRFPRDGALLPPPSTRRIPLLEASSPAP